MIKKETILACIKEPMEQYHQTAMDTIGNWRPLVDISEKLLAGKEEAYDIIYEKIGAQFFIFNEVKERLSKHFPFIHTCDKKTIETINAPVTDFTLAVKLPS